MARQGYRTEGTRHLAPLVMSDEWRVWRVVEEFKVPEPRGVSRGRRGLVRQVVMTERKAGRRIGDPGRCEESVRGFVLRP